MDFRAAEEPHEKPVATVLPDPDASGMVPPETRFMTTAHLLLATRAAGRLSPGAPVVRERSSRIRITRCRIG